MKIIQPGVIPPTIYRGTCENCGCKFECEEDELELEVKEPKPGEIRIRVALCPTDACGERVIMAEGKFRVRVRNQVAAPEVK